MGTTREGRRRRARGILSGVLAGLLAVGGGTALAVSHASPAAAAPVVILSPVDLSNITTTVFEFEGVADPNEPVRVDPATNGQICNTVADGLGNWQCFVTFTRSAALAGVVATGLTSGTADPNTYNISLQPVITYTPQTPGVFYGNDDPPTINGIAEPSATINGTVGASVCNTVALPSGAFSCATVGALGAGEGDYAIALRSTPIATGIPSSFNDPGTYRYDATGTYPDFSFPYDSVDPSENENTTDSTPLIGGGPGTAEEFSNVTVYAYQYSAVGTVPGWPPLPPDPGPFYCGAVAAADGSWSCQAAFALPVNSVWVYGTTSVDLAGNGVGSPDATFSVKVLPPPPPPTVITPAIGYQSLSRRVHVSTANLAEGRMYVREAGVDLCSPTPVANPTFSCDTVPLAVGVHHLNIFQEDQYGTFSASVQRTVTILAPPLRKAFSFTFRVVGKDGPVGADGIVAGDELTIEADGLPIGAVITAEIHSTPVALGTTTIGPSGSLRMPVTVPDIDAGEHEIFVFASAADYDPATLSSPVTVRAEKEIPPDADEVKELGTPEQDVDVGPGGGEASSSAGGWEDPTQFGQSLVPPFADHSFFLTPAGIALSGAIAVAFLLLVGLPAELLESTIRSNYDRAFGWLARLRRRVSWMLAPVARLLANPWVGTGLTILAASILLGFADPDFGFTGASVRLVLAMILAVVTINIGLSLVVMKVARQAFDVGAVLTPMPAALAIVGVSVLVSRLAGISPGFLFGIVLGIAYARELKLRDEARLGVLGVGLTIGAGLVGWLGYGLATAAFSGQGFFNNLLIEALAAITLEALGTLVVALLPIEFLDGRTIFRWSKLAWIGLYAVTVLIFLFVVVPLSDNWGTMSAPVFGWGSLFAVFAAIAIITWAVFRRRARVRPSSPEAAAPRQRSRR